MRRIASWIVSVLLVSVTAISAPAQAVDTELGRMEFIGLTGWDAAVLVDSIRALAPGRPLHACAVTLKDKLHFADASVAYFEDDSAVVVLVVGPQDSARVRYRAPFADTGRSRAAWEPARRLAADHNTFLVAVQLYGPMATGTASAAEVAGRIPPFADTDVVQKVWQFLERTRSPGDRDLAIRTLQHDGNEVNRAVAVAILVNFSRSDAAWRALVGALRDPSEVVNGFAGGALKGLYRSAPRKVDWSVSVDDLRAILAGTNLFAFAEVLELLTVTEVPPALGRRLLADNAGLVAGMALAEHPKTREIALRFLRQVSGRELATAVDAVGWLRSNGFD